MSLGEAFVEVHADLRPFARDLERALPPIVKAFERQINRATSQAMSRFAGDEGHRTGDRLGRGIKNSLNEQFKKKNTFVAIASSLAGALDDGISALPTEVKAAIVLGIAAVSPLVIGGLGGAIVAGIGGGLAALGILLSSQFDLVRTQAVETGRNLRDELVDSAKAFVPAVLGALAQVEARFALMRDKFKSIFDVSATFVGPLTQGTLDALDEIVTSIQNVITKFEPFVAELASGFQVIGDAVGDAIEILASMGDDGVAALRDLLVVLASTIVTAALLVRTFVGVYGVFRKVLLVLGDLLGPFSIIATEIARVIRLIDEHSNANKSHIETNTDLINSTEGTIVATKKATQALEEYQKALQDVSDAAKSNLELNVRWEESLDRISESLDKNGKSLDIHTKKGQNNINEFLNGLKIAEERALLRVQRGEATAEQAASQYRNEVAQLKELARQAGVSDQAFNDLFQEIIDTSALRISAQDMGVTDLTGALDQSVSAAEALQTQLSIITHLRKTIIQGGIAGFAISGYADGGIHALPDIVRVAEDGPEVTIPLTKPARAAALLQQSGLASMFGSSPAQIMVFVGNEELDSRTVRIVKRNNASQGLSLAQGPRRF